MSQWIGLVKCKNTKGVGRTGSDRVNWIFYMNRIERQALTRRPFLCVSEGTWEKLFYVVVKGAEHDSGKCRSDTRKE